MNTGKGVTSVQSGLLGPLLLRFFISYFISYFFLFFLTPLICLGLIIVRNLVYGIFVI